MATPTPRARWARRLIDAAEKPLPQYGSADWQALPDGDARKIAAVVVAAECWATDADNLAEAVMLEAEAFKRTEDADYQARAAAHRAEWEPKRRAVRRQMEADKARREVYGDDYGRTA